MKEKWNKLLHITICKLWGHKWVLINANHACCKRCGALAKTQLRKKK